LRFSCKTVQAYVLSCSAAKLGCVASGTPLSNRLESNLLSFLFKVEDKRIGIRLQQVLGPAFMDQGKKYWHFLRCGLDFFVCEKRPYQVYAFPGSDTENFLFLAFQDSKACINNYFFIVKGQITVGDNKCNSLLD